PGMRGRERLVRRRMPVLCEDHMRETCGELVDQGHDFVAARNRQRAARTEVVLDIDHQQRIAIADGGMFAHDEAASWRARRLSTSAPRRTSDGATSTGYDAPGFSRRRSPGRRSSSRAARTRMSASDGEGVM